MLLVAFGTMFECSVRRLRAKQGMGNRKIVINEAVGFLLTLKLEVFSKNPFNWKQIPFHIWLFLVITLFIQKVHFRFWDSKKRGSKLTIAVFVYATENMMIRRCFVPSLIENGRIESNTQYLLLVYHFFWRPKKNGRMIRFPFASQHFFQVASFWC